MGRFCLPVLETKLVEFVSQCPKTDAETFGSTRSVSLSILKRPANQLAFHFPHGNPCGIAKLERFGLSMQRGRRWRKFRQLQIFHSNCGSGTERDCPLNHIFKFAHISGPVMTEEPVDGFIAEQNAVASEIPPVAFAEKVSEKRNIAAPIPKRRDGQAHYIQPVIQVLAKAFFADKRQELPVGRSV